MGRWVPLGALLGLASLALKQRGSLRSPLWKSQRQPRGRAYSWGFGQTAQNLKKNVAVCPSNIDPRCNFFRLFHFIKKIFFRCSHIQCLQIDLLTLAEAKKNLKNYSSIWRPNGHAVGVGSFRGATGGSPSVLGRAKRALTAHLAEPSAPLQSENVILKNFFFIERAPSSSFL